MLVVASCGLPASSLCSHSAHWCISLLVVDTGRAVTLELSLSLPAQGLVWDSSGETQFPATGTSILMSFDDDVLFFETGSQYVALIALEMAV